MVISRIHESVAVPRRARITSRLAALALAGLLAACGGGPTLGGVESGGTGSFAVGHVSGLGSIIVNGVRYDDSRAVVVDRDDRPASAAALRLGMVVEVQGSAVTGSVADRSARSTASHVRYVSAIEGPVSAIGTDGLLVLGQQIAVDRATVFEDVAGLAGLRVGDRVEIHGFPAPGGGRFTATRIDRDDDDRNEPAVLVGLVEAVDGAARTLRIGGATIAAGGIALPAAGDRVRAALSPQPDAAGRWTLLEIRTQARAVPSFDRIDVEGYVTGFASLASFRVDGIAVDASAPGVTVEGGRLAEIADGRRVEVSGAWVDGVLVARRVEFEDDDDDRGGIELHGAIEALDTAAQTFRLRGWIVAYAGARFDDLRIDQLADGLVLSVEGRLDGDRIVADEVERDD